MHIDHPLNPDVRQFLDLLETLDLQQTVSGGTHRRGHRLNLVSTRKDDSLLMHGFMKVWEDGLCDQFDQFPVMCELDMTRPRQKYVTRTTRRFRNTCCKPLFQ